MSTKIQDLNSNCLLQPALYPVTQSGALTGTSQDMIAGSNRCFAIQMVGAVNTLTTWDVKVQESNDGSTNWTDVSGAAFATVTAASNTQCITFDRTKRYLRAFGTLVGTNVVVSILFGEQLISAPNVGTAPT